MILTTIGLMSGTSLDGVDVALIETDGKQIRGFGPSGYRPYTDRERGLLRQALTEAVHLPQRDARPGILREAELAVTMAHAEAVAAFTAQNRITCEDIDIVGFHGQTVLHRPERKLTVQIGDAAALAKAIHIPVMHDFRAADVAAGGQGAPFVPVYHRALTQSLEREGPIVVVNIGGVSNITYIDGADTLIACDTGPGNALLDDFMLRAMSQPFDREGRLAAQGRADQAWIARALELPFFALPPPKSLDRNDFAVLKLGADVAGRRRGDADGVDGRSDRPDRAAAAEAAEELDRGRRRRAQPDHAEDVARAASAGDRRGCRRVRLVRGCDRGAGFRLSRRARPERPAAKLSRNHRRPDSDDGRHRRAPLNEGSLDRS